jgi:hypothetical protein
MFTGDYWFASNPHEKEETIRQFLCTDEGIKTLLVIGDSDIADIVNVDEFECNVTIVTNDGVTKHMTRPDSHTKTIYVRPKLNLSTTNMMRLMKPILAIFTDAACGQPPE